MDNQQLLEQLKPYKEHITTVRKWDSFAKEHSLPSSAILINRFDSWDNMKTKLGLPSNAKKTYTLEELKVIAQEHKNYFTSFNTWNTYSQEHHLPSPATYIQHFEYWNEVKRFLGLPNENVKRPGYTKEIIEQVLREHGGNLENRTQWDEYAKEHNLPTYKTLKKFFTWEEIRQKCKKNNRFSLKEKELLEIGKKHYVEFTSSSKREWDVYAREHDLPSFQKFARVFGSWKKAKIAIIQAKETQQS